MTQADRQRCDDDAAGGGQAPVGRSDRVGLARIRQSARTLRDPAGPLDDTYPRRARSPVLDLQTHRAGIVSGFTAQGPLAEASSGPSTCRPVSRPAGRGPDEWLKHPGQPCRWCSIPGVEMLYMAIRPTCWSFIVARASGMPLEQFLAETIPACSSRWACATRLSMFRPERDGAVSRDRRTRWQPARTASVVLFGRLQRPDQPLGKPAGRAVRRGRGLVGTIDDYLSFGRMLHERWAGRRRS